jgi:hypothetical protein
MQQQSKMAKRWLAFAAAVLMSMGTVMLTAGTASAAVPTHAVLKFSAGEASLTIPPSKCPDQRATCQWMLYVNEPNTPGQTVVSTVVGTSGTLHVADPKDFCGLLQADILIGPAPWRFERGIQQTVTAPGCVPANAPAKKGPTLSPSAQLPFTGSAPAASDGPAANKASLLAAVRQLPFTGLDIRPLALLGSLLVLLGLVMMTNLEQRRRSLLGLAVAVRPRSVARATGRATRWFLGD